MSAFLGFILKIVTSFMATIDQWNASLEETNLELEQVEREIELERFQKGPQAKT